MSDPTIQSPFAPSDGMHGDRQFSLAEIDAMCRKAARGAGYSWGLAEEAGRAARWLAAYRLPGPQMLAVALAAMDGALTSHAPKIDDGHWHASSGTLCPITTGAALSDRADKLVEGAVITLQAVHWPLLIIPFLCRAARDLDCMIAMRGSDVTVVATKAGPVCADWNHFIQQSSGQFTISSSQQAPGILRRHGPEPWLVNVALWRQLDCFAQNTYVPASEASRRSGAGADDVA